MIVIVLVVDFLMGRFISEPISKLNSVVQWMANLDFSEPCTMAANDEFGELAVSLNTMADNLQQTLSKLEAANRQLEKDVEKERLLLTERKELADRLSHEMKTPLGVIRAYAEGMQDETDEDKKQKYSEVIIAETERMSELITTLLDLSALESGASRLAPERFDFVEFLETAAGRLLVDVPDADYELQYDLPEHKAYVYTDKARMEQVLNKLIINAKKNVTQGGVLKPLYVNLGYVRFMNMLLQNDDRSVGIVVTLIVAMFMGCTFNAMNIISEKEDGVAFINEILPMTSGQYVIQKSLSGLSADAFPRLSLHVFVFSFLYKMLFLCWC